MDHREYDENVGSLRQAMHDDGGEELYGWMRARYASFGALLAESRRPDWKRIAAGLTRLGVLDGRGNPPKPETARQTWWKVRRDIAARSSRSLPANVVGDEAEPTTRVSVAQLPASPASEFDPDDMAADEATEPEFRTATPRNWARSSQRRHATEAAGTDSDHSQDYAKVLRQLAERARDRSLPMPEIPTAEDE
jgi:hypothetical protein